MNAVQQAYEMLGDENFTGLLMEVQHRGGWTIQGATFFLAFVPTDGCAEVLFACGNLREIIRFARANQSVFGCERARWCRSLVGKHAGYNTYKINDLRHE